MKKLYCVHEPERTLLLHVCAIWEVLRRSGVKVVNTSDADIEEGSGLVY